MKDTKNWLLQPPEDLTIEREDDGLIRFRMKYDDEKMEPVDVNFEPYEALWIAGRLVELAREGLVVEMLEEMQTESPEARIEEEIENGNDARDAEPHDFTTPCDTDITPEDA